MRYRVVTTPRAKQDALEIAGWIAKDSPLNASRWLDRLMGAVEALAELPHRCPLAPENPYHASEIRHLLFGEYRVLFTIAEQEVRVLHVRHTARRPWLDA